MKDPVSTPVSVRVNVMPVLSVSDVIVTGSTRVSALRSSVLEFSSVIVMVSIVLRVGTSVLKFINIGKMLAVPVTPPKEAVKVSPAFTLSNEPDDVPVVNVIVPVKIPVLSPVSVRERVTPVTASLDDVTPTLIVPAPAELGLVTVRVAVSVNRYCDASNSIQIDVAEPTLNEISSVPLVSSCHTT